MSHTQMDLSVVDSLSSDESIDSHFRNACPSTQSKTLVQLIWSIISQYCLQKNIAPPLFHTKFTQQKISQQHFIERGTKYCQDNGIIIKL